MGFRLLPCVLAPPCFLVVCPFRGPWSWGGAKELPPVPLPLLFFGDGFFVRCPLEPVAVPPGFSTVSVLCFFCPEVRNFYGGRSAFWRFPFFAVLGPSARDALNSFYAGPVPGFQEGSSTPTAKWGKAAKVAPSVLGFVQFPNLHFFLYGADRVKEAPPADMADVLVFRLSSLHSFQSGPRTAERFLRGVWGWGGGTSSPG